MWLRRAYSRHGSRTGQEAQMRRAASTPTPSLGKKMAGGSFRQLPAAEPPPPPAARPGLNARWMAVVLVAALAGALVGGGVGALTGRRASETRPASKASFGSNSSRIAKPQDIQGILAKVQPAVVAV